MYLGARRAAQRRTTSAEIAAVFDVSLNHLVKVVNELARLGYIRTARGPGGGVQLGRTPESIVLGDFIEDFQGPMRLHECTVTDGICAIETFCKLKGIFAQADRLQKDFLDGYTLADFIPSKAKLARLAP